MTNSKCQMNAKAQMTKREGSGAVIARSDNDEAISNRFMQGEIASHTLAMTKNKVSRVQR